MSSMSMADAIYYLIAVLSLINFARILAMLIGSDIYDIKQALKQKQARVLKRRPYQPLISIVIPAYNEEMGVIRTLESVMANTYAKRQIIVVNDGSKDRTLAMLRNYQRKHKGTFTIVNQANAGKAAAINRAVRYHARGKLIMVLDADSVLRRDAIERMAQHFRDRRVIASAANVKILNTRAWLGIAQRFEYLISYRMKRALSVMNMEYIVGGVGSTFRRSVIVKVGLYDTDTITEDIDLTVKLIARYGNRKWRINYAADAVAYTEHVLKFRSLIKQRYRWKYGRLQTFLKHRDLFMSRDKKHDKRLTWYQLPYALFGELMLLIEPLLVGYIFYVTVLYGDLSSLLSVYLIITTYTLLMLIGEQTETLPSKLGLSLSLPFVYLLLYPIALVEFCALVISIKHHRKLFDRTQTEVSWEHVERLGQPTQIT